MFDLMTTVSVLVEDLEDATQTLVDSLGIPQPRPAAYRSGPGVAAVFCRVHPKYAFAPTFLELITAAPVPSDVDPKDLIPIEAIAARQGARAIKWHATEIAMPETELASLADHLSSLGVPIGFLPTDRKERFFIGGYPGDADYDASADCGLLLEAGRSGHLGLPEDITSAPVVLPPDAEPHTMLRIVARQYLTENLAATLEVLERTLSWTPLLVEDRDGFRRAVLPFRAARSAVLELVQPTGPGRVAVAYDELGPGAWTIRIAVPDVAAKARDLATRSTATVLEDGVLRADPAATLGVPFEFVADPPG